MTMDPQTRELGTDQPGRQPRVKPRRKEAAALTISALPTGPFGSIEDFSRLPSEMRGEGQSELWIPVGARAGVSMDTNVAPGAYPFSLGISLQDVKGQYLYECLHSVCLTPGMTVNLWSGCIHSHPQPGKYHLRAVLSVGVPGGKDFDLSEQTWDYTWVPPT